MKRGERSGLLNGYDVIHFHIGDLTFPLFSYTVRKPMIAHFHGVFDFYMRSFLSRLIIKKTADLYIAISHEMQKNLANLGVEKTKIRYIPNAVDTNVFKPAGNKEKNL